MHTRILFAVLTASVLLATGCASHPRGTSRNPPDPIDSYHLMGLNDPRPVPEVGAQCPVPEGWKAEPLKQSDRHTHQVWLSPTGKTAYGVIHFRLPLPVGLNIVHWEFLREMKKKEGDATELSSQDDPTLPGLRFICEGGRYRMRVNLLVDGFEGWAIYAGTLREFEVINAELELAERAREKTILGMPERELSAKSD
jgi:hypothetical protein